MVASGGNPNVLASTIGQTYKQQQKGSIIYILEGKGPRGNNKKRGLCDAVSSLFCHLKRISLLYKNNYVICMDFLELEAA